jgi:hypothetical protein
MTSLTNDSEYYNIITFQVIPFYATLCCAIIFYPMLCCNMIYNLILFYAAQYYNVLFNPISYHTTSKLKMKNSLFLTRFQDFSVRRIVGTEVFPGLYFGGLFCVCVPLAIMTFRYNPHQHYPSSTGKPCILHRNCSCITVYYSLFFTCI